MAKPTQREEKQITKIIERIDRKELVFNKRTTVMDTDYNNYWRQDVFVPPAIMGIGKENAVTTNFGFLLASTVSNAGAFAERIIRVEDDADNREFRDANNAYERLSIGMLELGDERLVQSGMNATIQGENMWNATVRGAWIASRALLIKDSEGETVVDVVPFDSRNVLYEKGKGEPLWAAHVTQRSKQDVRDDYPNFKFTSQNPIQNDEDDNDENVRVIDYYWTEKDKDGKDEDGETIPGTKHRMNCVIINNQYAKKPTDTFSVNFPVVIRMVGNAPPVMNFTLKDDIEGVRDIPGIEDLGPSIFHGIRHQIASYNLISSEEMALTSKAVQATVLHYSRDGTKTLDQDVQASGAEVNLSRDDNEDVKLMEVATLTRDAQSLGAKLLGDLSSAGVSDARRGQLNQPVSGAALHIVGQADNETIAPFLNPTESMLAGIIDNLGKQYETGRYKTIHVRGKTHTDQPFNRTISPEDIEGHGVLSVELMQFDPQDQVALWAAADMASKVDPATGMAKVSYQYASTKIAKVQDYDLEKRRIAAQRTIGSGEKYKLLVEWQAATDEGDEATAEFLGKDILRIIDREDMEEQALQFAFEQSMNTDPQATAAGGVRGGGGGGGAAGGGGQDGGNPATINAAPGVFAQAGRPGVSREPSPDAGFNTTAPRNGNAESAGLEPNV